MHFCIYAGQSVLIGSGISLLSASFPRYHVVDDGYAAKFVLFALWRALW